VDAHVRRLRVALTPEQRVLRSRAAAYVQWAKTEDRTARTEPKRRAFYARFEQQVDPTGELDPAERARRAAYARKAYMHSLALKSSQVRAAKRGGGGDAA
jgi:hypothetical protein